MQRELAGTRALELDLPPGATIEDAWTALVRRTPASRPDGPPCASPGTAPMPRPRRPRRRRRGRDDPAGQRRGRGPRATRILEIRAEPFGPAILAELGERLATPEDGAVVGFLGVTRRSPGTPAPGQEAEAARHAGRAVESLTYEALPAMALR